MNGKRLVHPRPLTVVFQAFGGPRYEEIKGRLRPYLGKLGRINVVAAQPVVLLLSLAPQVGVMHLLFGCVGMLDEQADGHALLDIKHVLVGRAVGGGFLFLGVAVQVENVDFVKRRQQALAHTAKGGVVQVGVVGNHRHHALAVLGHLPLGKAQELDVVVLQPLGISFA